MNRLLRFLIDLLVTALALAMRLLNCLPGEVPARVAELLERDRVHPANEPPDDTRDVLIYGEGGCNRGHYAHDLGWWFIEATSERRDPYFLADGWRELLEETE